MGPPLTRTGTFVLGQDGQASDGATLDIVSWSASGKTVTVEDGNDDGAYVSYVGTLSGYGIASPKHPGTATFYDGGSPAGSGPSRPNGRAEGRPGTAAPGYDPGTIPGSTPGSTVGRPPGSTASPSS